MRKPADVVIVGAGPAGASAAIHLSQRGYSVVLLEKARIPHDKLCGEFLSTEVGEMCRRLGVYERLMTAGARRIRRLHATTASGRSFDASLQGTALGVSRRTLDHLLFKRAVEVGADAHDGLAVRSVQGSLTDGFTVQTDDGSLSSRVVLGAYGRRSPLDRRLNRPIGGDRSPYVAFKAHFNGIELADVIELHAFPGGYCGLMAEDHGEVNVCWITHRRMLKEVGGTPEGMIERMAQVNSSLAVRFSKLTQTGDYQASSQLIFRPKTPFADDVCMIGDAAGMIAPICGDGMAMAMRSSELATDLIQKLLSGRIEPAALRSAYAAAWRKQFLGRMLLGRLIHAGYVHPIASELGIRAAQAMPRVARMMISSTRG